MPAVRARDNEPFEATYRRFRRAVEKSNVLAELRSRAHYTKPSALRKRERNAARKRLLKRIMRESQAMSSREQRHH